MIAGLLGSFNSFMCIPPGLRSPGDIQVVISGRQLGESLVLVGQGAVRLTAIKLIIYIYSPGTRREHLGIVGIEKGR